MTEIFGNKPIQGVQYPLSLSYCGNCSMPIEYCEYYPGFEKCKKWLEDNLPEEFERLNSGSNAEDGSDEKKRQKRGGKGMVKAKKKEEVKKNITVFVAPRGKKKTTVVIGLKTFGIDLKVASKFFGTKFACGSSVTGDDEIVIQGDIKDDLLDIIPDKWSEIDEDLLTDGGEHKR